MDSRGQWLDDPASKRARVDAPEGYAGTSTDYSWNWGSQYPAMVPPPDAPQPDAQTLAAMQAQHQYLAAYSQHHAAWAWAQQQPLPISYEPPPPPVPIQPLNSVNLPPPGYVCKRCGAQRVHFIKDCPTNVCNRCGQVGHIATTCRSAVVSANQPPPNYVCNRCGAARLHFIRDCPTNVCNRCGQTGHIATMCHAARSCGNPQPASSAPQLPLPLQEWQPELQQASAAWQPAAAASGGSGLAAGWQAVHDPNSGRTYYAHESGETTWDMPAPPTSAAPLLTPPPPPAAVGHVAPAAVGHVAPAAVGHVASLLPIPPSSTTIPSAGHGDTAALTATPYPAAPVPSPATSACATTPHESATHDPSPEPSADPSASSAIQAASAVETAIARSPPPPAISARCLDCVAAGSTVAEGGAGIGDEETGPGAELPSEGASTVTGQSATSATDTS